MATVLEATNARTADEVEFVTFYVGDLLIGVDVSRIEEINRHVEVTPVPHAPDNVRGVINLRGDVVTVLDLRIILGRQAPEITEHTRTVVVNYQEERIGLLVDRIADVVWASREDIEPPPANVTGLGGWMPEGVLKLERELLVLINLGDAVGVEASIR